MTRRLTVATAAAVLCAAILVHADVVQTGNGGLAFEGVNWNSTPPNKTATLEVLRVSCVSGYTCGYTNLEVDWDDGNFSSVVGNLPIGGQTNFSHTYASNGLYHIKLSADDNNGNWIQWAPFDVTIQ